MSEYAITVNELASLIHYHQSQILKLDTGFPSTLMCVKNYVEFCHRNNHLNDNIYSDENRELEGSEFVYGNYLICMYDIHGDMMVVSFKDKKDAVETIVSCVYDYMDDDLIIVKYGEIIPTLNFRKTIFDKYMSIL